MKRDFLTVFANLSVLIVEDNISQRNKLIEILSNFTDKIEFASDGAEALKEYEIFKPNIIITDIKMPNMSGLEFLKELRKVDKKTPVIVLSAHTDVEYLLEAVSLKLISYLVKPVTIENIIKALKEAVEIVLSDSLFEVRLGKYYTYNVAEKAVYKGDEKIKLSKKEILFLELLIKYKNQIVTKEMIEEVVWEDSVMTVPALKNFIFKLRKKIGNDALHTSSSNGYYLTVKE